MEKKEISKIPSSPGIYLFYDKKKPIYIGKATNLKARLFSHFNNADLDRKERLIVSEAKSIRYFITESDFRAILLESKLINKYLPKYNARGRDNKSFLYIQITTYDPYPKIFTIRKTEINHQGLFFGPYQNQKIVRLLLRYLRKIFPYCTQKKISRSACFYRKIGLCQPCPNQIDAIADPKEKKRLTKIYQDNIKKTVYLLEGKIDMVTKSLYQQLRKMTLAEKYEDALIIRNRIKLLEFLTNKKSFKDDTLLNFSEQINQQRHLINLLNRYFPNLKKIDRIEGIDISNFMNSHPTGSLVVYYRGIPDKSSYRRFKIHRQNSRSDFDRIKEVLQRRFKNNWPLPDLLIVDGGKPQIRSALKVILKLNLTIPIVGIAKAPDRLIIGTDNLPTVKLPFNHPGFNLLRQIRDESHRFSKKYHLLLRSKNFLV